MEIDKLNIFNTIQKMITAGKILPQKDRIRTASNPAVEEQKVLEQTVDLWWSLFSKQHISVGRWEQATDRAIMLNGIPKLEINIINPALMSVALAQVEKEYLAEQQVKYEQEKKNERHNDAYPFPEMGKLISYHLQHHHGEFIPLPSTETVMAWAKRGGWQEDAINNNMIKLRIYYNFGQYAKRDKAKMPIKIVLGADRIVGIEFVN